MTTPMPLDDEDAFICLGELCALDRPAAVLALFESQGWTPRSEVDGSDMALQVIVRYDAVETFKAVLSAGGADPMTGLSTRFWGGQRPVHHCAYSEISFSEQTQAPRCLAYILELMPLAAFEADENGRTALDWAAMAASPRAFDMLIDSLASACAHGLAAHEACQKAAESAAFFAIAVLIDPCEAVRRAGRLAELGMDWRSARGPGGESLLGRALSPANRAIHESDQMARALLDAGMSPDAQCIKKEAKGFSSRTGSSLISATSLFFGSGNERRVAFPLTFRWMLERLSDDQFFAASCNILPVDKASVSSLGQTEYGMESAVLLCSRHEALAERRALSATVPAPAQIPARRNTI